MPVSGNKAQDIARAQESVGLLACQGADLVVLPEMFCCLYDSDRFWDYAEYEGEGEAQTGMAQAAKEAGVTLIAGSIPEADGERLYNSSFVYSAEGKPLGKVRKNHLFDIAVEGGQHFQESMTLSPGEELLVFDQGLTKIGVAICFDIRFPTMALEMRDLGAEVLVYPAAFNMTTGPLHWELLCRARAIDAQVFVIGASSSCNPEADYVAWGHSLVVDPWGKVLADLGSNSENRIVEIDLDLVTQVRSQIPLY